MKMGELSPVLRRRLWTRPSTRPPRMPRDVEHARRPRVGKAHSTNAKHKNQAMEPHTVLPMKVNSGIGD